MNAVDKVLIEQLGEVGYEVAKLVTWWGTALETMPPYLVSSTVEAATRASSAGRATA